MNIVLGIVIVIVCTLLGYTLHGGKLLALYQPTEVLIICGAAFGAMVIANPMTVTFNVIKSSGGMLKASRYNKALYLELLTMMYNIFNKTRREGMMAIESDIDDPDTSSIFNEYPQLLKDHHLIDFICDYLRIMMMGTMASHELEALIDQEMQAHHEEAALVPGAISRVADALPGFGIVAAVLGIVITMGKLGGPPEELGISVAAALVGTLLGIILAYGFVGPFATYLEHKNRAEAHFYDCVKACMLASANGMPPQLAVECGRKVLYHSVRPSFHELEEQYRTKK